MATIKKYYEDAYIKNMDSTVLSCEKTGSNLYDVVLDATCFFPEAGGQSGDRGIIIVYDETVACDDLQYNTSPNDNAQNNSTQIDNTQNNSAQNTLLVSDTQIDSMDIIHHMCDKPISVGKRVHISIDWNRRHTYMQHHTAEHIFSGLVHSSYGYDNVGFHLSDNICTMDYNGKLSEEDIEKLELSTNECIFANLSTTCYFPSDDELDALEYRCKGELTPPIRIVEIDDGAVDTCACCAPHVKMTGEIGLMKVTEAKAYKGGTRLTIICGRKALFLMSRQSKTLLEASHLLSVPENEIPNRIKELQDERYGLKQEIISLHKDKLKDTIQNIPTDQRDVILFSEELETKTVRNCVNELVSLHSGVCGIFTGNDNKNHNFILASDNVDMNEIAVTLREKLHAKCGGSSKMIQGNLCASRDEIMNLLTK